MSTFNSVILLTTVFSKIYKNIRLSVIIQQLFGTQTQTEEASVDQTDCPEDDISVNLIEVIATYAATKIFTIFGFYIIHFVIKNKILGNSDFRK